MDDEESEKPKAFPIPRTIWFRDDQNELFLKAKCETGRSISDIIREGAVSHSRRLLADTKRAKKDK